MTGKEKCELLKQFRKEIADANGIVYSPTVCDFEGDCPGYCPKCDAEARYLDSELNRLASEGKRITIANNTYGNYLDKAKPSNQSMRYPRYDEPPFISDQEKYEPPLMGFLALEHQPEPSTGYVVELPPDEENTHAPKKHFWKK